MIISYPYDLTFFNMDDMYHNDVFTNWKGIKIKDKDKYIYLDMIYTKNINSVIKNHHHIYYEWGGYLIRYHVLQE